MSDLLVLTSQCNRTAVPVLDQPQLLYVLAELMPGENLSRRRLPLNFALVLDRSGSMAGEKLQTMKEAVKNVIDQLEPEDVISIITFESRTELTYPAQRAVDKSALKKAIEKIRNGGGTNMAPALKAGLRSVSQHLGENRVNRIILLTDGEATDREDDSRAIADEAGNIGAPIICLGFGQEWNEDFLIDLADRSVLAPPGSRLGMVDYIPTPKHAKRIFQEVYQSMQVVAQQVTLTVRMVQGIEARRVWQVTPMIRDISQTAIQGRAIQVQIGQLERTGVVYLIELMLPPRSAGIVRFAQADVTFLTPEQGQMRQTADLIVEYSHDPLANEKLNQRVMNVVEKIQAFRLQTQALEDAQAGDIDHATRKLRQAVTILLAQGESELAGQMQREADQLESSGMVSSEGKKTILLTSRKTVRLSG